MSFDGVESWERVKSGLRDLSLWRLAEEKRGWWRRRRMRRKREGKRRGNGEEEEAMKKSERICFDFAFSTMNQFNVKIFFFKIQYYCRVV